MAARRSASSGHPSPASHSSERDSDQPGKAPLTDPDLVNAWGLAASPGTNAKPGSPLWVADNGSDKATLYTGATATSVNKAGLVVSVTGAAPTGQVFNSAQSGFVVSDKQGHSGSSVFIFDTENGTIDGWSPAVGATIHRRAPGPAAAAERPADRHRWALGPQLRQRERRPDRPAPLLRRT